MRGDLQAITRDLALAFLGGDAGAAYPLAEAVLALRSGGVVNYPQCLSRPEDYFERLRDAASRPNAVGPLHGWLRAHREAGGFIDWTRAEMLCLRGLLAGWLPGNRPAEGTDLWQTLSADLCSLWRRWEQGMSPALSAWLGESLFATPAEPAKLGRQACLLALGHSALFELERLMIDHHAAWGE